MSEQIQMIQVTYIGLMDAIAAIGGTYSLFTSFALIFTPVIITSWIMNLTTKRIREINPEYKKVPKDTIIDKIKERLSFLKIFLVLKNYIFRINCKKLLICGKYGLILTLKSDHLQD